MELSALILASGLWSQWFWPIAQFVLGLTAVIFFHELGHFLVAKAVGIKVERFALGFGPRLLGIQIGETDYCIKAIPLGGYIKMLGQEDVRPLDGTEGLDPRSFPAKPVWARLCVISAGVVMNVILAAVLFVIVAMVGKEFLAPVVGAVRRHFPAAEAVITWQPGPTTQPGGQPTTQPFQTTGLTGGDRIVRIDGNSAILSMIGNEINRFDRIALLAIMADRDEKFTMAVQRVVDGQTWTGAAELGVRMGPSRMGGDKLSFGLIGAADTVIEKAEPDGYVSDAAMNVFHTGDRVVAIDGRAVETYADIESALAEATGATAAVRVRRDANEVDLTVPLRLQCRDSVVYLTDGTRLDGQDYRMDRRGDQVALVNYVDGSEKLVGPDELIFPRKETILDLLGMVPRQQVTGVLKGYPAEKIGLKAGDVVVQYGDHPWPTLRQLTAVSGKAAKDGKTALIVIERDGKRLAPMKLQPKAEKKKAMIGIYRHVEMDHTIVAAVRPGSPAARAGIESGCVIDKVNDRAVKTWPEVFEALKGLVGQDVTLTVRRSPRPSAEPVTASIGRLDQAAFDPNGYERTMFSSLPPGFAPLKMTVRKDTLGEALAWSARETGGFILTTYASLRSLVQGTVSKEDVLGPIGMGDFAIDAARLGPMHLIYFMAFISTILAVMNFLPIPVVDGGHAVLLIIEKIRGKPVPVKVVNIVQIAGLVLLVLVFVAVTFQDIMRLVP